MGLIQESLLLAVRVESERRVTSGCLAGNLRVSAGESGLWPRGGAEIPSWLSVHSEKDDVCLGGCTYQGWAGSGHQAVRCGWSAACHRLKGD